MIDQDIMQLRTLKVGTQNVVHINDETPAAELAPKEFKLTGPQSNLPMMFVEKIPPAPFDRALGNVNGVHAV